jgi:ABC-type sugar transport system substrate-binding protein
VHRRMIIPFRSFARRSAPAAILLAGALALTGCSGAASGAGSSSSSASSSSSSSAPASKGLKIGFSPFTLQVPALKGLADGLTAVGKSQGDTVITADPKGDPTTQLQQLHGWFNLKQVDAIWVIPVAGKTIQSVLTQAQSKGIVVIASGLPSDYGFSGPQAGITFTNVDNKAYGTKLGESTAQCIKERLGGKGKVIFLQSPSGQQSSKDIVDSFKSALASGSPDTKIVNTQTAKDRLGSQQEVSSALQGNPDANTVVGTDDESTLGALDAFKQKGKTPAKVCIVGAGGNDEAKAAVKSNSVYSDLAFNFQADLMQNIKELHSLAANPKATGKQLTTPIESITR